ncbi:class I SAM-dependent methyltransferase [Methylonatrum kenyense]|uniref:class I SAM-dependent methyltransferase n=1 Tax=Methylonatrum kenyense TaxID=455253 RepID=UPI0020BDD60C|nr:class I SAM-dependent methyltransferase [Methylonatrum kenyense]MCK8516682.1 class I SAM-dependent methyltransferase [Methylonatrum kenyense]
MTELLGLRCSGALQHNRTSALTERLGIPLLAESATPAGLFLDLGPKGLALLDGRPGAPGAVRADFLEPALLRRMQQVGARSEQLVRAVGATKGRRPTVVDATAGLGGDSLILAWAGCAVTLVERSPIVVALLTDALERVRHTAPDNPAAELRLVEADARDWLAGLAETDRPDVVYLDPMYPERGAAAAARKEMQRLKQLLGSDEDAAPELLRVARAAARQRVVIKRPRKAPLLAGSKPSHQISGRSTRFDVYMCHPGTETNPA